MTHVHNQWSTNSTNLILPVRGRPSTPAEIESALGDLRREYSVWVQTSLGERLFILSHFKSYLIDRTDTISEQISVVSDISREEGLNRLFIVIEKMSQAVRNGKRWLVREHVPSRFSLLTRFFVDYEPVGLVGIFGSEQDRFSRLMIAITHALVTGNVVLFKPAEASEPIGRLIESLFLGFPDLAPYVRVVFGDDTQTPGLITPHLDYLFLGQAVDLGEIDFEVSGAQYIAVGEVWLLLDGADVDRFSDALSNAHDRSLERLIVVDSVFDALLDQLGRRIDDYPVIRVSDQEQALEAVRALERPIGLSIWGQDTKRAQRIGILSNAITVSVNHIRSEYDSESLPIASPEFRRGRSHGRGELLQFTRPKGTSVRRFLSLPDLSEAVFKADYQTAKRMMKLAYGDGIQRVEATLPPDQVARFSREDKARIRYTAIVSSAAAVGWLFFRLMRLIWPADRNLRR